MYAAPTQAFDAPPALSAARIYAQPEQNDAPDQDYSEMDDMLAYLGLSDQLADTTPAAPPGVSPETSVGSSSGSSTTPAGQPQKAIARDPPRAKAAPAAVVRNSGVAPPEPQANQTTVASIPARDPLRAKAAPAAVVRNSGVAPPEPQANQTTVASIPERGRPGPKAPSAGPISQPSPKPNPITNSSPTVNLPQQDLRRSSGQPSPKAQAQPQPQPTQGAGGKGLLASREKPSAVQVPSSQPQRPANQAPGRPQQSPVSAQQPRTAAAPQPIRRQNSAPVHRSQSPSIPHSPAGPQARSFRRQTSTPVIGKGQAPAAAQNAQQSLPAYVTPLAPPNRPTPSPKANGRQQYHPEAPSGPPLRGPHSSPPLQRPQGPPGSAPPVPRFYSPPIQRPRSGSFHGSPQDVTAYYRAPPPSAEPPAYRAKPAPSQAYWEPPAMPSSLANQRRPSLQVQEESPSLPPACNPMLSSPRPGESSIRDDIRPKSLYEITDDKWLESARSSFQHLDQDHTGRIPVMRWVASLRKSGVTVDLGKAMKTMLAAKPDSDGCVDFAGFLKLVQLFKEEHPVPDEMSLFPKDDAPPPPQPVPAPSVDAPPPQVARKNSGPQASASSAMSPPVTTVAPTWVSGQPTNKPQWSNSSPTAQSTPAQTFASAAPSSSATAPTFLSATPSIPTQAPTFVYGAPPFTSSAAAPPLNNSSPQPTSPGDILNPSASALNSAPKLTVASSALAAATAPTYLGPGPITNFNSFLGAPAPTYTTPGAVKMNPPRGVPAAPISMGRAITSNIGAPMMSSPMGPAAASPFATIVNLNPNQWQNVPGTPYQYHSVGTWPNGVEFASGGFDGAVSLLEGPTTMEKMVWTFDQSTSAPIVVRKNLMALGKTITCQRCNGRLTFGLNVPRAYNGQVFACDFCRTQQPASNGVWHCNYCHNFDICAACASRL